MGELLDKEKEKENMRKMRRGDEEMVNDSTGQTFAAALQNYFVDVEVSLHPQCF